MENSGAVTVYRALWPRRFYLGMVLFSLVGLLLLVVVAAIIPLPGYHRKLGGLGVAGLLLLGMGAWQFVSMWLGYPRLCLEPGRVARRTLAGCEYAAWTSLAPFHVQPRPFGMDFGNDTLEAALTGRAADPATLRAGRFEISVGRYQGGSHALCAALNAKRAAACGGDGSTAPGG